MSLLLKQCPACTALNTPQAAYCSQCGRSLESVDVEEAVYPGDGGPGRATHERPSGVAAPPRQTPVGVQPRPALQERQQSCQPAPREADEYVYQGVTVRFCAWLLDFIIFAAPVVLLFIKVHGVEHFETTQDAVSVLFKGPLEQLDPYGGFVLFQVLLPLVFAWLTSEYGGTPGKVMCGIRVVDAHTGRHLGFLRALARAYLKYLLYFSVLMVGWVIAILAAVGIASDARRQAVHDKAVRSLCIIRQAPLPFGGTPPAPSDDRRAPPSY